MTANLHDVLLRPVISEKSTLETERNNYTFAVARHANKHIIKSAVEAEFKHASLPGVAVVPRIHHRSGVFGLIAPKTSGSNFIGVGVRVDLN